MSNCVVGSGGSGMPLGVVTEHGVEGYNHLAHHCDDDDLSLFTGGGQALGEGFERRIVSARTRGCHVENVTNGHATPIDTAVSLKLSAIEVVGRETDQGGDLLAINLAEFRQRGEESANSPLELNEMQAAARALQLQLHPIQVTSESALYEAFARLTRA